MLLWLLLVGILCSLSVCNGRGVDARLCGYDYFNCQCGTSDSHVPVRVKECTYFYRWKPKCKPCDDLSEDNVCPKYAACAECHQDVDQCVTCPRGRYGSWCTNECSCQNGASCNKDTGQCICPGEYEGTHCERLKGCVPPPPASPPLQEQRQPAESPATITYSCPNNFVLRGASVSTCLPGGQWSSAPPDCQCSCQNGASCDKLTGKCICGEEYEGTYCERKKGCAPPPPASPPLQEQRQPAESPITITYSCPNKFVLRGASVSTCLLGGQWSSSPPDCLKECPLLSSPAHGHMEFTGNDLIEGIQANVKCGSEYYLRGNQTLTCQANGVWNSPVPICERLAICDDPGNGRNIERTVHQKVPRTDKSFLQNTELKYACKKDFLLMGSESILCLASGTWSAEAPSCVKVPLFIPDCKTTGKDITAESFVPVRIWCPPECASEPLDIWGTSIYQEDSSICKAAVHGGKISNSGGLVEVVKNAEYSHFLGSYLNDIESKNYDDAAESFRFRKLSQEEVGSTGCPNGMHMLKELCVFVSRMPRSQNEADAICTNLGLRLTVPDTEEEQKRLIPILSNRGIKHLWNRRISPAEEKNNVTRNSGNETEADLTGCESSILSDDGQLTKEKTNCDQQLNFICINKAKLSLLASCKDPGSLPNGKVKSIGQINGIYYVGSSVQYTCDRLHFMSGFAVISCTSTGMWTFEKPTCIKIDTCEEPPLPTGGMSEFLSPLKTSGVQRSGFPRGRIAGGSRSARLPVGLNAELPEGVRTSAAPQIPEDVILPPGHYRIGTRAMYDCESRYYRLVGSRTRRCQAGGIWSGRPPTCIPICGKSDSPRTPFVFNGNATDIGQWPWQAGLARFLPDYNRWFLLCGGSLLNERWVITAAHCVTYAATTFVIEAGKFRVYLGKYHRSDSSDDEYVQVKQVQEIHIHPDYDPNLFDADIALLHLDSPVQLNTRVQPVCLPTDQSTRENLREGNRGVVTGWGMNENGSYSDTLQQAVLPVVSHSNCEKGYEEAEAPLTVTENMFCAGFKEGKADACSGDSGGPIVFVDNSSKEKEWILEGIVSWGSPKGCGNPNQYGGFTTVHKFLDWIHQFF